MSFLLSGIMPLKRIYDRINQRREINTDQPQNAKHSEVIVRIEAPEGSVSRPEYKSESVEQRFFVDQANNIVIKK